MLYTGSETGSAGRCRRQNLTAARCIENAERKLLYTPLEGACTVTAFTCIYRMRKMLKKI